MSSKETVGKKTLFSYNHNKFQSSAVDNQDEDKDSEILEEVI